MELHLIKNKLASVSNFMFNSSSNKPLNGLDGVGTGDVKAVIENEYSILFYENGRFNNTLNKSIKCSNIYRWNFNEKENKIGLTHLRFGFNNPVFLFDLVFDNDNKLISKAPHICKKDEYHAEMILKDETIQLNWLVKSDIKFNRMKYRYK